ncbi:MAG TPA: prepilin peptidase [Intrasporangium sp.]|uniref:prepilin peptidase n=1 Tax=Intrasporangium sp. TaxID=1925024 RepID=UPI002D7907EB|nr:prepilin peptidase [Intrasporangium sp.]HET7399506.1 prepilin peptidase [Intrasporangium sp.]
MTWAQAPGAPMWFVAVVALLGAVVGRLLATRLATAGYRLDDEAGRPLPFAPGLLVPLTGLVWAVLGWRFGTVAHGTVLAAYLTFATVGMALLWVDVDVHRLPTGLTRPALPVLAVQLTLASAASGDGAALVRAVAGAVALWLLHLALALLAALLRSGFGRGDVSLAGLVGLMTGYLAWWGPVVATYAAFLLGGAWAGGRVLLRRAGRRDAVAFGPWLLVGAAVALLVEVRPLL